MAEFPAFPLFTDAYLGDTTHLTTIEHGAYLLLLMVAWRSRGNKLPNDDRMLARYTKCTASQWKRIRPILEPFFSISSDGWSQGRLTDEANHVRQVRDSQIANGRASALKRKGRHSTKRDESVSGASTPSPSPSPSPKGIEESDDSPIPSRRVKFEPPPGFSTDQWRDFLINRKAKRLAMTQGAYDGICKKLDKLEAEGWSRSELIALAIEESWGSINTPRNNRYAKRFDDEHPLGKTGAALDSVLASVERGERRRSEEMARSENQGSIAGGAGRGEQLALPGPD